MSRFSDIILPITLAHEGGKVDHPNDPGGRTNKGITQRTFDNFRSRLGKSNADVYDITDGEAAEIYRRSYWNKVRGDDLPPGADLAAFDGAVNSGPSRGAKWLQGALGVVRDGKVGDITVKAANDAADQVSIVVAMCALRMGFLTRLRHWPTFKRGWTRRVSDIEARGVGMAGAGRVRVGEERHKAHNKKRQHDTGAAGAGAGGTAGTTQAADFPEWLLAVIVIATIAVVVVFIIQRIRHKDRADAYDRELRRMEVRK